ncbi:MAG TPA: Yip1 family protein [Thermoanaerobaculia bacterium]|nr:Yip1 family protein [Thermoanaerobaculia bacterium]
MTDPSTSVPPSAAATATRSPFQRLAGVLFAPAETFQDIARKPDFVLPLVLILVLQIIGAVTMAPKIDFGAMTRMQMEQSGRKMTEADMERAEKMGAAFGKVMFYTSPIWAIAIIVIIAAILMLAFRLFGGDNNFMQSFSVTLYSWIPMALLGLVSMIVILSRESIDPMQMATLVKSNPAFLVDMKTNPVLFSLLTSIDLFTIWTLFLLSTGFAAISRLSRVKSAVLIVGLWLAFVFVKVGFAALGASAAARAKA